MIAINQTIELTCPYCKGANEVENNNECQGDANCHKCGKVFFWWCNFKWDREYPSELKQITGVEYNTERLPQPKNLDPLLVKWIWGLLAVVALGILTLIMT